MRELVVDDAFSTTRGTVVAVEGSANELPVRRFAVTLQRCDGTLIHTHATVERLLRRNPQVRTHVAILIEGIDKSQVPRGSIVRIGD